MLRGGRASWHDLHNPVYHEIFYVMCREDTYLNSLRLPLGGVVNTMGGAIASVDAVFFARPNLLSELQAPTHLEA